MSRCVVCGALPLEQCNQDTHDAHYRMWQQSAEADGRHIGNKAQQVLDAIDRAQDGET